MVDEPDDVRAIAQIVHAINGAWRSKQYDAIASYLAPEVVIAPPGSTDRVRGREAYVQSYREYDQQAETLEFSASEVHVDLLGDFAVASTPFNITYRLQDNICRDQGLELLVFHREAGNWCVAWRTMHVKPE